MNISIGIMDDQRIFVKSLVQLINSFENFTVVIEGTNAVDFLKELDNMNTMPDIILVDVQLDKQQENGITVAQKITNAHPEIKLVALSMKDDDLTIIKMLKAGCCSYLSKDIYPAHLELALSEIHATGYYNADAANINYRRLLKYENDERFKLSKNEITFLQLACSDLTYKQIASEMHLRPKTIEGYREALFLKFKVQSRVGMIIEGLKNEIIQLT